MRVAGGDYMSEGANRIRAKGSECKRFEEIRVGGINQRCKRGREMKEVLRVKGSQA